MLTDLFPFRHCPRKSLSITAKSLSYPQKMLCRYDSFIIFAKDFKTK